jgi:hypothetical protein
MPEAVQPGSSSSFFSQRPADLVAASGKEQRHQAGEDTGKTALETVDTASVHPAGHQTVATEDGTASVVETPAEARAA